MEKNGNVIMPEGKTIFESLPHSPRHRCLSVHTAQWEKSLIMRGHPRGQIREADSGFPVFCMSISLGLLKILSKLNYHLYKLSIK